LVRFGLNLGLNNLKFVHKSISEVYTLIRLSRLSQLSSQFRPKQLKICLTLTYNKYYTAYSVSVRISYLLKPDLAHGPGDGDEVGDGKPDNDVKQLR